ncbi:lipopolysaccharide biosynthesis protein [uncultured Thiodictyon sp.]|uniref:lipopolysaccharide biosynthesis protein n=1 Tax=uncultured Thiodictyon sp. TaxID=1846217 RepID=UPI0025D760DB|nr:lipopolysaccharide biosynthesis protein [uncultured Thiodictyon sp.]
MLHGKFKTYLAGYLPLNLIQAFTSLGLVVVYTRLLVPEQYGRYALALIAMQWLQSLLFAWLHGGVARFYEARRAPDRLPALLTTAYGAGLCLSALVAVTAGLVALFLRGPWRWLVVAGLVSLIARSLLLVGVEAHRAARHVARYSLLEGTQSVLGLGLGALLVLGTGGGAAAALWGIALASVLVLLLDAPGQRSFIRLNAWSNDEMQRLARYGMPLAAAGLLSQIIANSDRFFIAWLIGEKAVGLYSVAYTLVDRPLTILFVWVAMAALPLAYVAMEREGTAAAHAVMENTAKTLILLMLPCTAGLAAVAAPLAAVVVGVEFREQTAHLIPWIALASLLSGATVHYTAHAFLITENTRLLLLSNLLVAILYTALNLLLIPAYGLDGAVAASIIAYALGFAFQCFLARRFLPVPLLGSHFIRAVLACGVLVALITAAGLPTTLGGLMLSILLGIVAYGISALALNVADSRSWLMARWRRDG